MILFWRDLKDSNWLKISASCKLDAALLFGWPIASSPPPIPQGTHIWQFPNKESEQRNKKKEHNITNNHQTYICVSFNSLYKSDSFAHSYCPTHQPAQTDPVVSPRNGPHLSIKSIHSFQGGQQFTRHRQAPKDPHRRHGPVEADGMNVCVMILLIEEMKKNTWDV